MVTRRGSWLRAAAAFLRYQYWIWRYDRLARADRTAIAARSTGLPSLRIVVRVDAASQRWVPATVRRLERQLFTDWQAALSFDAACDPAWIDRIAGRAQRDSRIRIVPDRDLAAFCGTGWVLLIAGGALPRPHAVALLVMAAASAPNATMIHADEDRIGPLGLRHDPYFKPGYSPERARQTWYPGGCVLIRRGPGDLPPPRPDAISWLRGVAESRAPGDVIRVPVVLHHEAAERPAQPEPPPPVLDDAALPRISILIPTHDRLDLLKPCLESIRAVTDYPREKLEILVIDNRSADPAALAYLAAKAASGDIRLRRDGRPFNFSAINNDAAADASGDLLVFLNNDTEIVDAAWLRRLAAYAMQDSVGAVGAKLVYPNGTVQHGGNILRPDGTTQHAHVGLPARDAGYRGLARLPHEVSGITGACLAVRAALFREIGFDPRLRVAFNDTLFCLELMARGYRNIYIGGEPVAIHHESMTRGRDDTPEKAKTYWAEAAYVRDRRPDLFADDPCYNPNLDLWHSYSLAFPPRRARPWRVAKEAPRG